GGAFCCSAIDSVAVQSDGRVLIGGDFTTVYVNGEPHQPQNRIARLNADGTLDATFNVGLGADDAVFSVVLQTDGTILLGGWFTSINGITRNGIARLNPDGSLDTTFNPNGGARGVYPFVSSIAAKYDGKVVVRGAFAAMNGVGRNGIARLYVNGTLDPTFNPGSAFNGYFVPGSVAALA